MSVMEQRRSVGYVGLPPNLLSRDMHGSPRVFTLLPGFNRSERRWLATMLRTVRRRGGARAQPTVDDPVLAEFCNPLARRWWFWSEVGSEPPAAGEFSRKLYLTIDYWLLLQLLTPTPQPP